MRAIQTLFAAAILAVLLVIAFELHQLAADFQIGADLRTAIVQASHPQPETPEQHKARIDAEAKRMNKMVHDESEVFTRSMELDSKPPARKPAASR